MPDPLPKPLAAPRWSLENARKRPQPRRHAPRSRRLQTRHPPCRLRTAAHSPAQHRLGGDTLRESPRAPASAFSPLAPAPLRFSATIPLLGQSHRTVSPKRKRMEGAFPKATRHRRAHVNPIRSLEIVRNAQSAPSDPFAGRPSSPLPRLLPAKADTSRRAPSARPQSLHTACDAPLRAPAGLAPGMRRPSARPPSLHIARARQTDPPAAARLLRPRRARRSAIGDLRRSLRLRRRRTGGGSGTSPRRSPARGSFSPPRRARRPRTGRDRALRAP